MNWVKFDFDNIATWPKKDSRVIVRYFDRCRTRYTQNVWYWEFNSRDKSKTMYDFTYYDERKSIKLFHDDNCIIPHNECFITHWCYLDEPNDGYWKPYKHENGNVFADKPYIDTPCVLEYVEKTWHNEESDLLI